MAEFFESVTERDGFLGIDEECAKFGFGCGRHDSADDFSNDVDWVVVDGLVWVLGGKEEVAAGAAAGFGGS